MNRANWRDVSSLLHLANNCCLELPARPDHGISKCSCHMLCASAPSHTMTSGILQIYVALRLALGWVRWLVTVIIDVIILHVCVSYKPELILTNPTAHRSAQQRIRLEGAERQSFSKGFVPDSASWLLGRELIGGSTIGDSTMVIAGWWFQRCLILHPRNGMVIPNWRARLF